MYDAYGTMPAAGITFQGDNDCPKENQDDYLIANNILLNCEYAGIRTTRKATVKIYNNMVSGCPTSYMVAGNREDGASLEFYNNISYSPSVRHFYFNQNYSGITYDFECDNNLYYPDADQAGAFYWFTSGGFLDDDATLAQWITYHAGIGDTVDGNSITNDPKFLSPDGGNFKLLSNSPAIDTGIDVGLTQDYEGNPIPQGLGPDIGAYESSPSPARISQADEKINNLASVLSGIQSAVQDILKRIQELF